VRFPVGGVDFGEKENLIPNQPVPTGLAKVFNPHHNNA
jgi:hypothetical protein